MLRHIRVEAPGIIYHNADKDRFQPAVEMTEEDDDNSVVINDAVEELEKELAAIGICFLSFVTLAAIGVCFLSSYRDNFECRKTHA